MWVSRNQSGAITGAFANPQPGLATEELVDDNQELVAFLNPPKPQLVLPQDLIAQFTVDDATKIQTAVAGNISFWLLWQAMTAQRDPMSVSNDRFRQGWTALTSVLGADRMTAIATALQITIS